MLSIIYQLMPDFLGRIRMDGRTISLRVRKNDQSPESPSVVEAHHDESNSELPGFTVVQRNGRWQPLPPLPDWVLGQEFLICSLIDRSTP